MREIKGPREVLWKTRPKITNSLSGHEINSPCPIDKEKLARLLEEERRRFRKTDLAIEKSRQKLLAMRAKLKATKEMNSRIQEFRHNAIRQRYMKTSPNTAAKPVSATASKLTSGNIMHMHY